MKILVIGLGSIAKKHIAAVQIVCPDADVFALRSKKTKDQFNGVSNIYEWSCVPYDLDFILISNPTSEHFDTIKKAIEFKVPLFIEKPPLMDLAGSDDLLERIDNLAVRTYTAFNLRFLPSLIWLKEELKDKRIIEVQSYCGSFLPNWRPKQDYTTIYSSKKALGGGVHFDLIHELDFLTWIFGQPNKVTSITSKISDLDIDSFDIAHYSLMYNQMAVFVTLNYYRKDSKRTIEIIMDQDTWVLDLLTNTVTNSQDEILFHSNLLISDTYVSQMSYFIDNLYSDKPYINDLHESIKTLKICLNEFRS